MAMLLLQPLLALGYMPGIVLQRSRLAHRWVGTGLVMLVLVHVLGLWLTSPPDVIDALLFRSPTPFSAWGVIAMWAIFAAAMLAATRRKIRLAFRTWRYAHTALAVVIVICTVVHAALIEGTMEPVSKAALSAIIILVAASMVYDLRKKGRS
jgi:predicted ferric reductase